MRLICQTSALNYSMCLSDKSPSETFTIQCVDQLDSERQKPRRETITAEKSTGESEIIRLQHTHRSGLRGKCECLYERGTILQISYLRWSHSCVTLARSFAHSSTKKHHHHSFILSLCSFNELFMTMNTKILSIQTLFVNEYSHIWFPRASIYQLMGISAGNNDHLPCWEEGWQFVHLS